MMKNPPHPGQGLKDEIETLGVSVAQFAKALGVTRQQLYRLINGHCGITPEMAMRLEVRMMIEPGQRKAHCLEPVTCGVPWPRGAGRRLTITPSLASG